MSSHIDFTDVENALELQSPYDGRRSTNTLQEAGIVSPGFAFDEVTRKIANMPVNEFLGERRAATAANNEATRYDVYFNPGKMSANTLIHEALHSATRLNDSDLAKLLTGIDYSDGNKASVAVSDILALNGCGHF